MKGERLSLAGQLLVRAPYFSYQDYDLQNLQGIVDQPMFREGIRLASLDYYRVLERKGFRVGELSGRELHTLRKYANRACFRAVPFGAFASCGLAGAGSGPLVLGEEPVLHRFVDGVREAGELVNLETLLWLNPCLYQLGGIYHHWTMSRDGKGRCTYRLDGFDADRFFTAVFAQFEQGPVPAGRLVDWLVGEREFSPEDAQAFVENMVAEQTLVTRALPSLLGVVPAAKDSDTAYGILQRDAVSGGVGTEGILDTVNLLHRLAVPAVNERLEAFKRRFRQRFDRQRVPLLEALDLDFGLAYGNEESTEEDPAGDLPVQVPEPGVGSVAPSWGAVQQLVLRKLSAAGRRTDGPLVFSPEEIRALPEPALPLPASFPVMFRHTAAGLCVEQAGGAAAVQIAARFNLGDEPILNFCRELTAAEQMANPEVIFADIDCLYDAHTDNINRRRPVYPWVISLLAPPVPEVGTIRPADLFLRLVGDTLVLESGVLNKRVIPRLATAFNYHHLGFPLFNLLCDLQYQGVQGVLPTSLESLLPGLDHYPRWQIGTTIISPASWRISPGDIDQVMLPARVTLGEGDQQLVFDLRVAEEKAFFQACIAGRTTITVRESLQSDDAVLAAGKPVAAQFVAYLTREDALYTNVSAHVPADQRLRRFEPGSDWLYWKLYCSPQVAAELLREVIGPVTRQYAADIRCWFFIRYEDEGGYHLRLRIRADLLLQAVIQRALRHRLKQSRLIERVRDIQSGTYERELERYGPELIGAVENLFRLGSEMLLAESAQDKLLLEGLQTAGGMVRAWLTAMPGCAAFVRRQAQLFFEEFHGDKRLRLALDRYYRDSRKDIELVLATEPRQALERLLAATARLGASCPEERKQDLLASLVHMQLNRLFPVKQRRQEMLVYAMLDRYYTSLLAREGKSLTESLAINASR